MNTNGNQPDQSHSWQPIDLISANLNPPEPPTIGGIVYPGRKHVFSGEPGAMKSWGALVLAQIEMDKGNCVMYIDFEMGQAETLFRLRALGVTDDLISQHFIYIEPTESLLGDAQITADILALIAAQKPTLVIVDAFTGALEIHGFHPDSGVEVERFYRKVVNIFLAHNAAFVVLDHLTKNPETRGQYAVGSERKIGGAAVHLRFETIIPGGRGKTGKAKISVMKDRPAWLPRPKAAELELVGHQDGTITPTITLTTTQDDNAFRPTTLMERVSQYLELVHAPASRNSIEQNIKGKTDYKRMAIDSLIEEGYAVEEAGPHGAREVRLITPFREPDIAPTQTGMVDTKTNVAPTSPPPRWAEEEFPF